jgi:hypothetical protein
MRFSWFRRSLAARAEVYQKAALDNEVLPPQASLFVLLVTPLSRRHYRPQSSVLIHTVQRPAECRRYNPYNICLADSST